MFLPWLVVTTLLAAVVAVLAATNASTVVELATMFPDALGEGKAVSESEVGDALGRLQLWPLLLLILPVLAYARYRAVEFRYLLDNVRRVRSGCDRA